MLHVDASVVHIVSCICQVAHDLVTNTLALPLQRNTRAPTGLQAIKGLILDEVTKSTAVRAFGVKPCFTTDTRSFALLRDHDSARATSLLCRTKPQSHDMQALERASASNAENTSGNSDWRAKPATAPGVSSAAAAASAAVDRTTAAQAAAAAQPDIKIQRAEDIGRTKWEPVKDLNSTAQAKQKLRGILNKLTPDNFEKLVSQVRLIAMTYRAARAP